MAKTYKCTNYGICTEAEKETIFQESDIEEVDGKFVCPKCGQELEEIKKKPGANWKIIISVLFAIAIAIAAFFVIKQSSCGNNNQYPDREKAIIDSLRRDSIRRDSLRIDSLKRAARLDSLKIDSLTRASTIDSLMIDSLKNNQRKRESTRYSLDWGIYEGQMRNGKPNGIGVVTVTKTYYIDLKDMSSRKVKVTKGDVIKGAIFKNGKLNQGIIHFANGERESINIGG